jgi:hypothetical protein
MSRESKLTAPLAAEGDAKTAFLPESATGPTVRIDAVAGSSRRTQKSIDVSFL